MKKDCLLVQPLYYHYPNEEEAYEAKNQYFFGSELMVAPITEALDPVFHSASVSVWFPDGVWYDFFHDWKYEGRGKLTVFRTSQIFQSFARAGAIIPMDAQAQKWTFQKCWTGISSQVTIVLCTRRRRRS